MRLMSSTGTGGALSRRQQLSGTSRNASLVRARETQGGGRRTVTTLSLEPQSLHVRNIRRSAGAFVSPNITGNTTRGERSGRSRRKVQTARRVAFPIANGTRHRKHIHHTSHTIRNATRHIVPLHPHQLLIQRTLMHPRAQIAIVLLIRRTLSPHDDVLVGGAVERPSSSGFDGEDVGGGVPALSAAAGGEDGFELEHHVPEGALHFSSFGEGGGIGSSGGRSCVGLLLLTRGHGPHQQTP
mmetsp:Transcript_3201/g.5841  ORF Transcript_3201/g.5841 Transcript_3201/m.5841 type:complete len:241 (-) Transcript_3201:2218-2940(-)